MFSTSRPLKKKINKRKGKNQDERDSPLTAIKNSMAANQQHIQQMQQQALQPTKQKQTGNNSGVDPKHKQRQQKAFTQQNQGELSQYLKYKDPTAADINAAKNSNGRQVNQTQQKGRGRNSNPNTPQKTFQILVSIVLSFSFSFLSQFQVLFKCTQLSVQREIFRNSTALCNAVEVSCYSEQRSRNCPFWTMFTSHTGL